MKSAVLFSGGKDSTMAAFFSLFQGWNTTLICVQSEEDSYMFHHPNTDFCKLQAHSMGLPIHYIRTNKARELADLKAHLEKIKTDCIVSGAVASEYQKQRIDVIAEELNIPSFSPLWHKGTQILEEIAQYLEIYIVHVAADGLGSELLGKRLTLTEIYNLSKLNIHPFFEGGEGETFVSDAPFFRERLEVLAWDYLCGSTHFTAKISKIRVHKKF
ncbi:MAG: diphthine--ammonia ligase [Candidatus Anstonellales archaeon]